MARSGKSNFDGEIKSSIAGARGKQPPTPPRRGPPRGGAQLKEGTAAEEASESPAIEAQEARTGRDPRTGQVAIEPPQQQAPMQGGAPGPGGGGGGAAAAHAASIAHAILAHGMHQ